MSCAVMEAVSVMAALGELDSDERGVADPEFEEHTVMEDKPVDEGAADCDIVNVAVGVTSAEEEVAPETLLEREESVEGEAA